MLINTFDREQYLGGSIESVWEFISTPSNLKIITPDYMGFDILNSNLPDKMYPGIIINYRVSPNSWFENGLEFRDNSYKRV